MKIHTIIRLQKVFLDNPNQYFKHLLKINYCATQIILVNWNYNFHFARTFYDKKRIFNPN